MRHSFPTYEQYTSRYLSQINSADHTHWFYQKHNPYILPYIGNMYMDEISQEIVSSIPKLLRSKGYVEKTIAGACRSSRCIWNHAVSDGIIEMNPWIGQPLWHSGRDIEFPTNVEEHLLLLNSVDQLPLRSLFGFSYITGIPIKDLVKIPYVWADPVALTLRIDSKYRCGRFRIPDGSETFFLSAVSNHNSKNPSDTYLFTPDTGRINYQILLANIHILRVLTGKNDLTARHLWQASAHVHELLERKPQ